MKLDRSSLFVVLGLLALSGCARTQSAAAPVSSTTLTSAGRVEGPQPRAGKVQRSDDASAREAEEEAGLAPKDAGRRPNDRREAGRQGTFGAWK